MATQMKYLDYAGLELLVQNIKAGDAKALSDAKAYVGVIPADATEATVIEYLMAEIAKAKEAANVTIADANEYYTATTVEGALAEVKKIADDNATAIGTINGEGVGSIKKALADAKAYTDGEIGTLTIGDVTYDTVKEYVDAKDAAVVRLIDATSGDLASLTTDAKTDVVSAINEVDAHVDANTLAIGKGKTGDTAGTGLIGRIEELEAAVGEGGGVSDQITTAIEALDADVTSATVEAGKGIQVQVVEADGVITTVNVTGDYSATYDAIGAAKAVQGETTETVASLKGAIDALGTAADADVATVAIGAESEVAEALPTVGQVKAYVTEQIADLEGAMHFVGVITRNESETDEEAIKRVVTAPKSGDVVVMSDNAKEYIFVDPDPETEGGELWREVGDEGLYVKKSLTIAGVDLQNDVTKEELLAALNVADGAQVNVLEKVKVNGAELEIAEDKSVNVTVAEGSANGTIAVNGSDVAVHGLGSAAYTEADAYDAAGTAEGLVGDLSTLTTTAKSTVVAAINEVKAAVGAVDYSGKADKVADAVEGNFAGLDAAGNLTDSGKKASDFDVAGAAAAVSGYSADETAQTVKQVAEKVDAITKISTEEITALFAPATE